MYTISLGTEIRNYRTLHKLSIDAFSKICKISWLTAYNAEINKPLQELTKSKILNVIKPNLIKKVEVIVDKKKCLVENDSILNLIATSKKTINLELSHKMITKNDLLSQLEVVDKQIDFLNLLSNYN